MMGQKAQIAVRIGRNLVWKLVVFEIPQKRFFNTPDFDVFCGFVWEKF